MELREMQYILAIEKYMNISRAAEALYISQPTLSKCLQKVETDIGQALFKRVGRRLILTYAGEIFIDQARNIIEMEKSLTQQLNDIVQNDCGLLNVAFPIMRATYMLPEILPIFRERYPNVQLKIMEAHSYHLDEALIRGDVDIAFFNQGSVHPNLEYDTIRKEELVLVAAPDSPLKQRAISLQDCKYPYLSLRSASDQLFILTNKKQRTRQIIDAFLTSDNIKLNNTIEITNIFAGIQLAANGYGITLTSESHIHHMNLPENISLFSIAVPGISSDFVAATRRNCHITKYAHDFIDIVRQCY